MIESDSGCFEGGFRRLWSPWIFTLAAALMQDLCRSRLLSTSGMTTRVWRPGSFTSVSGYATSR